MFGVCELIELGPRGRVKEVAFLWNEKHLKQNHKLTCVTTRYSGGSYVNEVNL